MMKILSTSFIAAFLATIVGSATAAPAPLHKANSFQQDASIIDIYDDVDPQIYRRDNAQLATKFGQAATATWDASEQERRLADTS